MSVGELIDVFVDTPGGRLFARTWPHQAPTTRPPIVLFHDSLGCVDTWRDFPLVLAETTGHSVVAYDRLGFGRSDARSGTLDRTFIRHEALTTLPALRAALGIDRMILFGHSVGGAMAVAAAAHWQDATVAVITESAQTFVEDRTTAAVRDRRAAFEEAGQIERLARYHGEKARWVLNAWSDTWLATSFATWTLDDDLRRLSCPVLAMHGDRDEYGSRAHLERIAALTPSPTEVVGLEGCGHLPHREQPALVLRAVKAFLETHAY